jgi:hypothetical protein
VQLALSGFIFVVFPPRDPISDPDTKRPLEDEVKKMIVVENKGQNFHYGLFKDLE